MFRLPPARWVLTAVLYVLLLVGLWRITRNGGIVGVIAGSFLVTAAAVPTALRLRHDILDAPGLCAAMYMLMFGLLSLVWVGSPPIPAPGIGRAQVAYALVLVSGGVLAFALGVRLTGRVRPRSPITIDRDASPHPWLLFLLLAIGAFGGVIGVSKRIVGFGSSTDVSTGTLAASQGLYQVLNVGSLVVLAAALVCFSQRRRYLVLVVLGIVQVAIGFAGGFKALSITPILYIVIAYVDCLGRIPWRVVVTTLVVSVLLLLPGNAIYRALRQPEIGAKTPPFGQLVVRQLKNYALFRFRLIDHVALIQARTPSLYPYANGSHYEYLPALIVVPRALWSDKPVLNDALSFSHSYWQIPPYFTTTSPPTQVGDLYRNFRTAGVLIGLFIWGLVVGGLATIRRRWRSPRVEMIYIFSLVAWVTYIESDLPQLILGASKSAVVAVVVAWLVLPGRAGVPGYRRLALGRLMDRAITNTLNRRRPSSQAVD